MFIAASNGNLVITAVEVEFSEITCGGKAIVKVVDAWDGKIVFDGDVVECTVVTRWGPLTGYMSGNYAMCPLVLWFHESSMLLIVNPQTCNQ